MMVCCGRNEELKMVKYVTYGITKENFFKAIFYNENHMTLPCKPLYGLWGSRVDTKYGWKDWCEDSGFRECSDVNKMEFVLTKESKILEVHKEEDILPYIDSYQLQIDYRPFPRPENMGTDIMDGIDFKQLRDEGYDGLELFISDDYLRLHNGVFNAWDCDSIVV
nr:hypothetical protein [uncultured Lachnoclostridium sp.]